MPNPRDAQARADLAAAQRAGERRRAQAMLDEFVATARAQGLPPRPLRARAGSATVRTDREGWYLRVNHTLAVGTDAQLYILTLPPAGVVQRLRGVRLTPTGPSLTIGAGGRDGESGPLQDFLDRALQGL